MSSVLDYDHDTTYHGLFDEGLERTGMHDSVYRRPRFYNLVQLLGLTRGLPGDAAEAGCYLGLSSFLMCRYLRLDDPDFRGEGFHVVDSFEGLSAPVDQDRRASGEVEPRAEPRLYAAPLEGVRRVLAEFPAASFHKGWIPQVWDEMEPREYRFVHVDVDLYEPTRDCLEYFFPRLVPGGMLVCDDYGYMDFPGAKRAVEEFSRAHGVPFASLTTGNALLRKAG